MIPYEQSVILDALIEGGVDEEDALGMSAKIIAALKAEGYSITVREPGS